MVLHTCSGTFSIATVCLLLPKHTRFMEGEVDLSCMVEVFLQLILLYGRQVQSKESGNDRKDDFRSSADIYVIAVEVIQVRKHLNVFELAEGLPLMPTFPSQILYYLNIYFDE